MRLLSLPYNGRIKSKNTWVLFLILAFSLIRFINLDADPGLFKRHEDVGDEAYWGFEARNFVLYGRFLTDELTLGASQAPLNTLLALTFFKLFGVSTYTLRLPSVVFSLLTILLAYFFLRKYDRRLALWGTLFLAINYNYFLYSRIGHPEALVSFFLLLTFFLLEREKYPFAGLSFGLAVAAKTIAVLFAPAILLYLFFRLVRREIRIKSLLPFASGGMAIGLALLAYEFYLWDSFRPMFQEASRVHIPGVKSLLFQLPSSLAHLYESRFLINPVNIILVICLAIYLWRISLLDIFSRRFARYVRGLGALDLIIISWVLGYGISLLVAGQYFDDRRLQLFSVVLSFIPAVILFDNRKEAVPPPTRNLFQAFLYLVPLVLAGNRVGEFIGNRLPAFDKLAVVLSLLSLAGCIALAAVYRALPRLIKLSLLAASGVTFVLLINVQLGGYLGLVFQIDKVVVKGLIVLLSTSLLAALAYSIIKRVRLVGVVYSISLAFIVLELATPQFSVRDASRELARLTTEEDYVVGLGSHMLSYNARYHPVWWSPQEEYYGIVNNEFVRKVKPQYLIMRTEYYGKEIDQETWKYMPLKVTLDHLGARGLEEVSSLGIFPVFGEYRERRAFYRLVY